MSENDEKIQLTHYELLGVSIKATQAEIKKAFKRKSQQMHPDKGGSDEAYAEIRKAYKILSNPESRYRYDTSELQGISYEEFNFYLEGLAEAMTAHLMQTAMPAEGNNDLQNLFDSLQSSQQSKTDIKRIYTSFLVSAKSKLKGDNKAHKAKVKKIQKLLARFESEDNMFFKQLKKKEQVAINQEKTSAIQIAAVEFLKKHLETIMFKPETEENRPQPRLPHNDWSLGA